MSSTVNKISSLINSQVPEFVRINNPLFVEFLEAFYQFLEQRDDTVEEGNLVDRLNSFSQITDVDGDLQLFSDHLFSQYLALFPKNVPANKATLVKNIKDFYRSKGTEKSYRFLFRALFGEDIQLYYPRDNILIASSGKWFVEKSIRVNSIMVNGVSMQTLDGLQLFVNTLIEGQQSNATAIVERVLISFEFNQQIYEVFLSNQEGNFVDGEVIETTDVNGNVIEATIASGIITEVSITQAGSLYNIGDRAVVQSDSGSGAIIYVSSTTVGNVEQVTVLDGGAGFRINDPIIFISGSGSGANGYVSALQGTANSFYHANSYNISCDIIQTYQNTTLNVANYAFPNWANANSNTRMSDALTTFAYGVTGPIGTVTLTSNGAGFVSAPVADAVGNTTIKKLGILGKMVINDPGLSYANGDIITFNNVTGGFGTGATANVISVNVSGSIMHVQFGTVPGFPSGGTGYDPAHLPTVSVSSVHGTGANIAVTALLGYGDPETIFSVEAGSIGSITGLTIGDPGHGFATAPIINLASSGDGTAQAIANIVVGTFTYPGRFLDETGFPSGFNFIQDQDYYQNFSYVIRVKQSIDQYRKYVKNLVHPSGMKLWGQYEYINDTDANVLLSVANTYSNVGNSVDVPYSSFSTGFLQRTTAMANNANGMQGFVSLWFNTNNLPKDITDSNTLIFFGNTANNPQFSVTLGSRGVTNASTVFVKIMGKDSGGNTVLEMQSHGRDVISPNDWIYLLASWDLSNANATCLYLTNVASLNVVTFVANSNIAYNTANIAIGSTSANTLPFSGNLSQVVFDPSYVNFSAISERIAFISNSLYPTNVVISGSSSTGLPPLIYMSCNTSTINVNGGFGGDFLGIGTFTGNTMFGVPETPLFFIRYTVDGNIRVTASGDTRITENFDV